jgi:hydroxyacylglutathione hydrolase
MLLSGGALLVGDLARPDLLGGPAEAEAAARTFCRTIQEKILPLPDHVEVFPTHVAGSLCGGNIGSRLSTTVGFERRTNPILASVSSMGDFVAECIRLDDLPAVPPYWRRMRHQNLAGVAPLGVLREPPALPPAEAQRAVDDGAVVLDTRSPEAFGGGHLPGALNAGQGASFATWAGTVLDEDAAVVLVLDSPADLWTVTWDLLRIGYPLPVGWLAGGMLAWRTAARALERLPQITVHELHRRLEDGAVDVLDVRQPAEWQAGHVEGATFVTGAELPGRLDDVPRTGRPVAVVCGSGYRSSVSASVLAARTDLEVVNVLGGMRAWEASGYPLA